MRRTFKRASVHYSDGIYDDQMGCVERHAAAVVGFIAREARAATQEVIDFVGECAQAYGRSFTEALYEVFGRYRSDAYSAGRVGDVPDIYAESDAQ